MIYTLNDTLNDRHKRQTEMLTHTIAHNYTHTQTYIYTIKNIITQTYEDNYGGKKQSHTYAQKHI